MTSVAIEPRGTDRLDRVGAVASSLCAVHCAVCALLPAAFGALGMGALLGHEAEWVFMLIAVAFAAGALISGWRRHRSVWVAGLLALGIAGLLASRGLETGAAHSEHHGEAHHPTTDHEASSRDAVVHAAQPIAPPADERGGQYSAHADATHFAGTAVGIFAGLTLMLGHMLNICTARRCRNACCE